MQAPGDTPSLAFVVAHPHGEVGAVLTHGGG